MTQLQCAQGHLYSVAPGQSELCPVCATMSAELLKTRGIYEPQATRPADPDHYAAGDTTRTVGVYDHLATEVDPVVGWLACVDGADRGRDWRLVAGRNPIGRGEGMPVRLSGDAAVSRERHAVVSFEPKRQAFTLLPGESRGLVYHNGVEVLTPVALKAHDRIELGKSTLIFIPLAGPDFSWSGNATE